MLTANRRKDQIKVLALQSEKCDAPFVCPQCRSEVILHKGRIKIHHFKHKPPTTCARSVGETAQHLRAKIEIYNALSLESNITQLEIEKIFDNCVADVYACIDGVPVAIEIQRSHLSVQEITSRTIKYQKHGVAVLWVGLSCPNLSSDIYSPRAWERWCHAAYGGRVYYWQAGQVFQVIHFAAYTVHVESRSWYDSYGDEQSAGGYDKISKRYKTPRKGVSVLLSRSFRANPRSPWSGGTVSVPKCLLYIDIQPAWWK